MRANHVTHSMGIDCVDQRNGPATENAKKNKQPFVRPTNASLYLGKFGTEAFSILVDIRVDASSECMITCQRENHNETSSGACHRTHHAVNGLFNSRANIRVRFALRFGC